MLIESQLWKPSINGWLASIIDSLISIDFSELTNENLLTKVKFLIEQILKRSSINNSKKIDLFQSIRFEYLRNNRIQRLIYEEKYFSIEQVHTNLVLLETKQRQAAANKFQPTVHKDFIIDSYEHVYGIKSFIDTKDIFDKCKEKNKKVLLIGRAGIGKSTFCQSVAYRWAKGEMWTYYQFVILIHLRFLTNDRYPSGRTYSPIDLVEKEYFPYDKISNNDKQRFKKHCDKGEVLWILDGYDEFVDHIPEQLLSLFNYLINHQHHILTSRPYAISIPYDVITQLTGFTSEQITVYIQQFFEQIHDKLTNRFVEGQKLLTFLKSNPVVWSCIHIPIKLELMCSLWFKFNQTTTITNISNVTELYQILTEWLCRKYLLRRNLIDLDKEQIFEHFHKQLSFLESLAFHEMEANTIILQPNVFEKNSTFEDYSQLIDMRFLRLLNDKKPIDCVRTHLTNDYCFVHLHFQEYFAGRYLINILYSSSNRKGIEFIRTNKYNVRYLLVFTFAAGILNQNQYESCRRLFWNAILDQPLDIVGFQHVQLLIYCIDQTNIKTEIPDYQKLLQTICQWIKCIVTVGYATIFDKLIYSLQRSIFLVQEAPIMDQIRELLQSSNSEIKQNTYKIISALATSNPHTHLLSALIIVLDDENPYVRADACLTLGKIGENAAKPIVISKLLQTLDDNNDNVRRNACKTLGDIGVKVVTHEMLNKLVSILADENEDIREHACQALGKLGEKAATNEVIDNLVKALGDENWNVRVNVCKALHAIGGHKAMTKVISKLMEALDNDNWKVKGNAIKALGEIGESAATSEVIGKLVSALGDENWNVRENACRALPAIGGHVAMTELISMLVEAFDNDNWMIRANACTVLGNMEEKITTSEVISTLVNAFGDENDDVRKNASDALGRIARKAPTNELINKLLNALQHDDWKVRKNACIVLGRIGEKIAVNEVFSRLMELQRDENKIVRWRACQAICQIGKNVVIVDDISTLLSALTDEHDDIRQNVCYALGEIGEKIATTEVINNLIQVLNDTNENVREHACQAFGKMGKSVATESVVNKLTDLVEDTNWQVRASACQTLGKLGEQAATKRTIQKLLNALDDKSWKVRQNTCHTLGQLGAKIATNQVITKLVAVLGDELEDVRENACRTLCKLGEIGPTNEIVNKLMDVFSTENENIRCNACYALCEMADKAATKDVLLRLVTAFDSDNANVRGNVCRTVCEMGEHAAIPEVINMLMNALTDENDYVRCSACEAFGAMSQKAASIDVIRKLLIAIEDKKKNVRLSAFKALSQMGTKADSSEVAENLLRQIDDKDLSIQDAARRALKKTSSSFNVMINMELDTVEKFLSFIERDLSSNWESISPHDLIRVYLNRNHSLWLSIATLIILRQGNGVTITENSVIVYSSQQPVVFQNVDQNILESIVNAFREQTIKFGLIEMRPLQVQVSDEPQEIVLSPPIEEPQRLEKTKKSSSVCTLL